MKAYFTFEVAPAQAPRQLSVAAWAAPSCAPRRSHFLVLEVETELEEVQRAKEAGGSPEDLFMPLVTAAFSVIDGGGRGDGAVSSDKAWECYEDSELAPSFLNPGQKAKGKIVLDVAAAKGRGCLMTPKATAAGPGPLAASATAVPRRGSSRRPEPVKPASGRGTIFIGVATTGGPGRLGAQRRFSRSC